MIGVKLMRIRTDHGYTLQEFADKMNVTRNTVKNYEDGKTIPDILYIRKICEEFNIKLESLVFDDILPKPEPSDSFDSYEVEGTFQLLFSNSESEQESNLLYNFFLTICRLTSKLQHNHKWNTEAIHNYVAQLKETGANFETAYLSLYSYLFMIQGSTDFKFVFDAFNNLLDYYNNDFHSAFNTAFDTFYGKHTLD